MISQKQCKQCAYSARIASWGYLVCCDYNLVHLKVGDKGNGEQCALFEKKTRGRKKKAAEVQAKRASWDYGNTKV